MLKKKVLSKNTSHTKVDSSLMSLLTWNQTWKIRFVEYTFFIRTRKFCLRLAVLNFFFLFEAEMFLICSYFPDWTLQCHKECQTGYNKSTLFHFFHFFFFQAAHIGRHWEVFYKKVVLQLCQNLSKNTCEGVQFFMKVARFKSATLLKLNSFTAIFHRFWTQMKLYTL